MNKINDNNNKMILIDNDDIEYILEFKIENDHIKFKIIENKVYAPFIYENNFTMKDFIDHSSVFRCCDSLEEVLYHLNNLYKQNKITLNNLGLPNERYIYFNLMDISEEIETEILEIKLKMTENKDDALVDLYNIQKEQIQLLKKIKKLVNKYSAKEHPFTKIINNLLKECDTKI